VAEMLAEGQKKPGEQRPEQVAVDRPVFEP
jgi:hypothetical protein